MVLKDGVDHQWDYLLAEIDKIVQSAKSYDSNLIKSKLKEFIPEYHPSEKSKIFNLSPSGKVEIN